MKKVANVVSKRVLSQTTKNIAKGNFETEGLIRKLRRMQYNNIKA